MIFGKSEANMFFFRDVWLVVMFIEWFETIRINKLSMFFELWRLLFAPVDRLVIPYPAQTIIDPRFALHHQRYDHGNFRGVYPP